MSYAGVAAGERVLDVGCGTGVVAVTAARRGAKVRGLDLSPRLLERARWNADLAGVEVEFTEGPFGKTSVRIGGRNITDEAPPLTSTGYLGSLHSPYGRYLYASVKTSF